MAVLAYYTYRLLRSHSKVGRILVQYLANTSPERAKLPYQLSSVNVQHSNVCTLCYRVYDIYHKLSVAAEPSTLQSVFEDCGMAIFQELTETLFRLAPKSLFASVVVLAALVI